MSAWVSGPLRYANGPSRTAQRPSTALFEVGSRPHGGNDTLLGAAGNDWMSGAKGGNTYDGGEGNDVLGATLI